MMAGQNMGRLSSMCRHDDGAPRECNWVTITFFLVAAMRV
jgi:hypothetical protein